jgi:hypothetical protein
MTYKSNVLLDSICRFGAPWEGRLSELSECLKWTGRRVWLCSTAGAAPDIGTIVHAFPAPFNRTAIDLAVRLKTGSFTVVSANQRGTDWDFVTGPQGSFDDGRDPSEPRAA